MGLFDVMHVTGCLGWVTDRLPGVTGGHPVAEVMLIGWSFSHMVKGASSFGTPVALSAPVLAPLGHDPVDAIVGCLRFHTLGTVWGAAGTPLSFGFGGAGLADGDLVAIGLRAAAVLLAAAAVVVPPLATAALVSSPNVRRSAPIVAAAVATFVAPLLGLAACVVRRVPGAPRRTRARRPDRRPRAGAVRLGRVGPPRG
ncbi:hypothetical protein BU14_0457s0004 [Porphyra umbilicalis]|uniref:Uncharacterized protein n=1 Tax=Porphyra umbilicalis TaxID=2786 RepID=A0A1X6NUC4_PORUM|nr:hypothetical protein BU14_0457s0004 [Porphyra umbilicalis]|eukprot:OSX72211.1 hypothetical protein BU14_0457s0004 [Porphyra umbilicalis]